MKPNLLMAIALAGLGGSISSHATPLLGDFSRLKQVPKPPYKRKPGILDQIQTCESKEAAYLLFHTFLDSANCVSQKTINKATRLLETLEFPLA